MIWTLQARDQSQIAANYVWTYTGSGAPTSPQTGVKAPVITFTAGAHTVTLTLNSVAQPTFVINAVAGTGAQADLLEAEQESESAPEVEAGFDPAAHTVTEVIGFVEDNPDQLDAIVAAEQAGKDRVTLVQHLESMRPS